MKKTKLAIGLLTALLTAGTLAGCDTDSVLYSPEGVILTYTDSNGATKQITAEDIFKDYYNDSDKYSAIFDTIKSIVVRNYFTTTETVTIKVNGEDKTVELGQNQVEEIKTEAQRKVNSDKHTATVNAKNNNSNYDKELDAILKGKGVETIEELKNKYIDELKTEKFEENFYKYHMEEIKNGSTDEGLTDFWKGYFKDMVPYHVSHILVKLGDSSATNYWNGTIEEDDVNTLCDVVDALKAGKNSFGSIAYLYREKGDTGSAEKYGDLGIMDYSTGYVNEFKLGVYAYENMLGKATDAQASNIKMDADTISDFRDQVDESYGTTEVPTIDYKVFTELKAVADVTKAYANSTTEENEKTVLDDNKIFYPRNIIYNRYLNRHSYAFIASADEAEATGSTGFHQYTSDESAKLNALGKKVLSTKVAGEWKPIIVVRAGTSDYQGIHFIVVNRDPFLTGADQNGTNLTDYYTTYYPGQDGYPVKKVSGKNEDLQTYVNFNGLDASSAKQRADDLKTTLKGYDSDKLNKYIYKKYMAKEEVKIKDAELAAALDKWIERSLEQKEYDKTVSWTKTWNGYIDTLRTQNSARKNLLSQACRIGYKYAMDKAYKATTELIDDMAAAMVAAGEFEDVTAAKTALTEEGVVADAEGAIYDMFNLEGGLCNDGKEHK